MTEIEEKIQQAATDLARKFDWVGDSILKVAEAALTDANFHHEAEIIHMMIDALEKHDQPGFTLTVTILPDDDYPTDVDQDDDPDGDDIYSKYSY